MPENIQSIFHESTATWFSNTLGSPTPVQEEAWPAIAGGSHTLVSAPTGTGKTLSAFLVFIDRLKAQARAGELKKELQLIYISPLKALAGDIRENLRRPLNGIYEEEQRMGIASKQAPFDINVAIRTGDTTQSDRRKMIKSPPHILITTPESLYLMLTSASGRSILCTARALIIDELHALIGSKRGAHLMLSIARLDKLCAEPLQRIGLSATIEPLKEAAHYLSPEPVIIAAPKMHKAVELTITSPMPDDGVVTQGSIWPDLARVVYEHCTGARTVIAFVEGRMHAEKLAYYVNQLGSDGFARTHHGSVSKEQRFEVEQSLRDGKLRLLCATSSMELGIDVGDIDRVLQIGNPRSISGAMQRLGRAGHNPGRVSVMHIFPRTSSEGLYCGLTAQVVRDGGIERSHVPLLCFDVLAQHLVSMATGDGYGISDVLDILKRAYPFQAVTLEDIHSILCMLAGDYEHKRDIPVRPRILYDRINGRVEGDAYSRMLAISTGGSIPDKGLFAVRAENGAKLGELDEEFVFEARVGDKFLLGSFAWKIVSQQKDTVVVTQSNPEGAQPPFWKGDWSGRPLQTGLAFGTLMGQLGEAMNAGTIMLALQKLGLDETAAKSARSFLSRQLEATGILPDERTIVIEHFCDEAGDHQMMVHSMFGRQVNAPLAILAQEAAERTTGMDITSFDDEDGFLLFPYGGQALPKGLLQSIMPQSARPILAAILPATSLFNMAFRYNASRALMLGVRKGGRQPLWVQRLRGAEMLDSVVRLDNHPLIRETKRECLDDYWDLSGLMYVLEGLQAGTIQVHEVFLDGPSPMSLPLRRQAEATLLYEYSPTPSGIHVAAQEALEKSQMIAAAPEQLQRVSQRGRLPEDAAQLHSLLMIEGDLIAGELDVPVDWLESLAIKGRAHYIEPGLWIAAEQAAEYAGALEQEDIHSREHIVRRALRYRGPQTPETIAERYFWADDTALGLLTSLCEQESAVLDSGLYYHGELYDRARRETVQFRRKQIRTLPPQRYAALMASRIRIAASPSEQLLEALTSLCNQTYSPILWESVLLPTRVSGYRPALLDTLLAQGGLFWRLTPEGVSFHQYEDVNWDADLTDYAQILEPDEKIVYDALLKRGASFMHGLSALLPGISPHDILMKLAEKGLAHADSFVPVRQWLNSAKAQKSPARQRINSRVMTLTAGRWELSRPLVEPDFEQLLEKAFDQATILCRETAQGLPWLTALEILRVWEYTGRVRRGYYIEGLSGAQFIREKDFAASILALDKPTDEIIWLSAVDPSQIWGKKLAHIKDREFICVPGTVVALHMGEPVAIFERQGQTLRVFEQAYLSEALTIFAGEYAKRRLFPQVKRMTIKQYPPEAAQILEVVGFAKQMQDYVLYQGYI